MFQNYVVTALRNLAKHRLYSFINIAGLAVALASAILIMLFVRDELSWDKWVPGQEGLYRVEATVYPPGRDPISASSSMYPLAGVLKNEVPGVVVHGPRQVTVTHPLGHRLPRQACLGAQRSEARLKTPIALVKGRMEDFMRRNAELQICVIRMMREKPLAGDANAVGPSRGRRGIEIVFLGDRHGGIHRGSGRRRATGRTPPRCTR